MILLKGERTAHTLTGSNSDTVITAFDLPRGSELKGFRCKTSLVGASEKFEREVAVGYAVGAVLIELDDPDTAESYQDLWDRFVTKYTDVDTIDFDTTVADTASFWEPGEADFEEVFDMGDRAMWLYHKKEILNLANPGNRGVVVRDEATPFEPIWFPAVNLTIASKKRVRIRKPSMLLIAVGSPALDDTTTARPHLTEVEWGQIQFIESTIERSLMDQLDIVEAGASVTWEAASAVLRKHLAPDVFEQTAAAFLTNSWNVFTELEFRHTVPGTMSFRAVDLTPV